MSDTPTTAEQVALDALARDACCHLCAVDPDGPWVGDARAVVAALRNSPAALADLNGGEWVQPTGPGGITPHWQPNADFRVMLALPEEQPPPDTRPLFVFVPRKATNG